MVRPFVVPVLIVLLLPVVASVQGPGGVSFSQRFVQQLETSGEPSIKVDTTTNPATVYVTVPEFNSPLYRSTDGGLTYARVNAGTGCGGDTDVATDAVGRVYFTELVSPDCNLITTIPVYVSNDRGVTWARSLELDPTATGLTHDRQWLDARGDGQSIEIARAGNVLHAWTTSDAWVNHVGPINVATDVSKSGPVVYAPDGTIYVAYEDSNSAISVAKSVDAGITWAKRVVAATNGGSVGFTAIDVDAGGNVYVAWDQMASATFAPFYGVSRIWLSRSMDGATTWSTPQIISEATSRSSIFPWIAAGAAGHADVAWYVENALPANTNTGPNIGGPTTTWDVQMAQTLNGASSTPTFTMTTAVTAFHTGSICNVGLACADPKLATGAVGLPAPNGPVPFDRRVLDFFELDTDASGNALIAYPLTRHITGNGNCAGNPASLPALCSDDRRGDPIIAWNDIKVAQQVGGPTL